ncbi:MAG: hypothetical protein ACOCQQ_01480, partial [Candidatus Nanoarchaeia archaeon]
YHVALFQKTIYKKNCNAEQLALCRLKFQQLLVYQPDLSFTRKEFTLFVKKLTFCVYYNPKRI